MHAYHSHKTEAATLYSLTNVCIGIWSAGSGSKRKLLLSLPDRKLFVVVVVHAQRQFKRGALGRALQQVNHLLDKRNPFSNLSAQGERHAIVALELEWGSVVGMDFLFPLHQDARLVLESRMVTKRLFHTLPDLEHFYGWKSPGGAGSLGRGGAVHHDPRLSRLATAFTKRCLSVHPVVKEAAPSTQHSLHQHHPPHPHPHTQRRARKSRSIKTRALQQSTSLRRSGPERSEKLDVQHPGPGPDSLQCRPCSSEEQGCCAAATPSEHGAWAAAAPSLSQCPPASGHSPEADAAAAVTPGLRTAGEQDTEGGEASCTCAPMCTAGEQGAEGCAAPCTSAVPFARHGVDSSSKQQAAGGRGDLQHSGGREGVVAQLSMPPPLWQQGPHLYHQHQDEAGSQDEEMAGDAWERLEVPSAARWTTAAATYSSRTLVIHFREASLTDDLRLFVQSDMRLLKLYESGLPAWALFLPSYGLPYHPWMRRATWLLFIALSFISMACGFYDLYKNIPFVKQFVTSIMARIHLPAAAVFEWLERHTQIRLSILLTWLFSRSPLFTTAMRALRAALSLASQLLTPLTQALTPHLAAAARACCSAVDPIIRPVAWLCSSVALTLSGTTTTLCQALGGWCTAGFHTLGSALTFALSPVVQLLSGFWRLLAALGAAAAAVGAVAHDLLLALAAGPALLLASLWAGAAALGAVLLHGLAPAAAMTWQLVLTLKALCSPAVAALTALGPLIAGSRQAAAPAAAVARHSLSSLYGAVDAAAGVGSTSGSWSWLAAERALVLDFMRSTGGRCLKAAQAVAHFAITCIMAVSRHRVSLLLQAKQALPPRARHALSYPQPLPDQTSQPLLDAPRPVKPASGASSGTGGALDPLPLVAGSASHTDEEGWAASPPLPPCFPTASPKAPQVRSRSKSSLRALPHTLPGVEFGPASPRPRGGLGPLAQLDVDLAAAGSWGLTRQRRPVHSSMHDFSTLSAWGADASGGAVCQSFDQGLLLLAGPGAGPGAGAGARSSSSTRCRRHPSVSQHEPQVAASAGVAVGSFNRSSWSVGISRPTCSSPGTQAAGQAAPLHTSLDAVGELQRTGQPLAVLPGRTLQGKQDGRGGAQGTGHSAAAAAQRPAGARVTADGGAGSPSSRLQRSKPPLQRLSAGPVHAGGGAAVADPGAGSVGVGAGGAMKGAASGASLRRYSAGCKERGRGEGNPAASLHPGKVQ